MQTRRELLQILRIITDNNILIIFPPSSFYQFSSKFDQFGSRDYKNNRLKLFCNYVCHVICLEIDFSSCFPFYNIIDSWYLTRHENFDFRSLKKTQPSVLASGFKSSHFKLSKQTILKNIKSMKKNEEASGPQRKLQRRNKTKKTNVMIALLQQQTTWAQT